MNNEQRQHKSHRANRGKLNKAQPANATTAILSFSYVFSLLAPLDHGFRPRCARDHRAQGRARDEHRAQGREHEIFKAWALVSKTNQQRDAPNKPTRARGVRAEQHLLARAPLLTRFFLS